MATLFIKNFSDELHKAAKVRAVLDGTTLREVVEAALQEYLERRQQNGGNN